MNCSMWNREGNELPQSKPDGFASSLGEGASGAPGSFARPLRHLRCQLSQRESLWRNRRLCNLPDNFPAMPRAPSQRGLSAQQTGGVSADTPSGATRQLPQGDAFALCRKPYRHHQKPSPWGRWLRPTGADGRGNLRSGALCTSARTFPAMPRALPLGELARSA